MRSCQHRIHKGDGDVYIPFWASMSEIEGLSLKSYADLIRFSNLPKAILLGMEGRDIYFWAPALRMDPNLYLRLSRVVTIAQPLQFVSKDLIRIRHLPITVHPTQALESLRALIWSLAPQRNEMGRIIQGLRMGVKETCLDLIPFSETKIEFSSGLLMTSFLKNALRRP
ncbi:MAG: hypothetical protein ACK4WB_01730 [Desulfatiglandales bacterium]